MLTRADAKAIAARMEDIRALLRGGYVGIAKLVIAETFRLIEDVSENTRDDPRGTKALVEAGSVLLELRLQLEIEGRR